MPLKLRLPAHWCRLGVRPADAGAYCMHGSGDLMTGRRNILLGFGAAALDAALPVVAQRAGKFWRIGHLSEGRAITSRAPAFSPALTGISRCHRSSTYSSRQPWAVKWSCSSRIRRRTGRRRLALSLAVRRHTQDRSAPTQAWNAFWVPRGQKFPSQSTPTICNVDIY